MSSEMWTSQSSASAPSFHLLEAAYNENPDSLRDDVVEPTEGIFQQDGECISQQAETEEETYSNNSHSSEVFNQDAQSGIYVSDGAVRAENVHVGRDGIRIDGDTVHISGDTIHMRGSSINITPGRVEVGNSTNTTTKRTIITSIGSSTLVDNNIKVSGNASVQVGGLGWPSYSPATQISEFYFGLDGIKIGDIFRFSVYDGIQLGDVFSFSADHGLQLGDFRFNVDEGLQLGNVFSFSADEIQLGDFRFNPYDGQSRKKSIVVRPESLMESSLKAFLYTQGALWTAHAAKTHFLDVKHQWHLKEGVGLPSAIMTLFFSGIALALGTKAGLKLKQIGRTIAQNVWNEFKIKHFFSSFTFNAKISLTSAGIHAVSAVFFAYAAKGALWLTKKVAGFTQNKLSQALSGNPIKLKTIFRGKFTPFQTPFAQLSPLAIAIPASVLTYKCAHVTFSYVRNTFGHTIRTAKDFAIATGIIS